MRHIITALTCLTVGYLCHDFVAPHGASTQLTAELAEQRLLLERLVARADNTPLAPVVRTASNEQRRAEPIEQPTPQAKAVTVREEPALDPVKQDAALATAERLLSDAKLTRRWTRESDAGLRVLLRDLGPEKFGALRAQLSVAINSGQLEPAFNE